jgi:hypothetical protein
MRGGQNDAIHANSNVCSMTLFTTDADSVFYLSYGPGQTVWRDFVFETARFGANVAPNFCFAVVVAFSLVIVLLVAFEWVNDT